MSSRVCVAEPSKHSKITRALLCALPCQAELQILLGKIVGVSMMCYQFKYKPAATSMPKENPQDQISLTDLLDPQGHPVSLARQMLLIAAALQHLPPSEMIPGLTEHHHVFMGKLAEAAIKLVTTNDELLGTLEGLENVILEAFYHIDSGNVRRAWITIRRAVMAAQLMSLHRPGQYRFKVINDEGDLDPEAMWACIIFLERLLSLLLGLPTSTGTADSAVRTVMGVPATGGDMPTLVVGVIAKILERNDLHLSQKALEMTQEIDRELIQMTQQMPSRFWRPLALESLQRDSDEAFWEIRRGWNHMCYYTMVIQLHLPYMICPNQASQNVYSRIACVNASREILTREIAVRTFNRTTPYYRMGDFMALVAGLTLMLAHIVSHSREQVDDLLVHQRLGDRAVVEQALECMESMSEVHKDLFVSKCATLLKYLLAAEAQTAQGQSHSQQGPLSKGDDHERCNELIIMVPYVGAIKIARGGVMGPFKTAQARGTHEDVSIGCIQILHVDGNVLPDQNSADIAPSIGCRRTVNMKAVNIPATDDHTTFLPHPTSEDLFTQQDQMFPDAAAAMDDWVFQGFDTAFFDVLMREAEA